jgi:hypothetical protein
VKTIPFPSGKNAGQPTNAASIEYTFRYSEAARVAIEKRICASVWPALAPKSVNARCAPSGENDGMLAPVGTPLFGISAPVAVS